jgi:hypothetical protein
MFLKCAPDMRGIQVTGRHSVCPLAAPLPTEQFPSLENEENRGSEGLGETPCSHLVEGCRRSTEAPSQ